MPARAVVPPPPAPMATLVFGLALILASAWPVSAHSDGTVHATIEVRESPAECPGGAALCLLVVEGSLADARAGSIVEITFRNTGRTDHEVLVTSLDERTAAHTATERSGIHAASERPVPPGSESHFLFEVPGSWRGVYLWCGVAGHEESGMWLEVAFDDPVVATATPGLAALLAFGCAAAFQRRGHKTL